MSREQHNAGMHFMWYPSNAARGYFIRTERTYTAPAEKYVTLDGITYRRHKTKWYDSRGIAVPMVVEQKIRTACRLQAL